MKIAMAKNILRSKIASRRRIKEKIEPLSAESVKLKIFYWLVTEKNIFVYFLDVSGSIVHAAAEQPQIFNSNNIQFKSEFPDLFHLPVFWGKITFSLINTLKFQASLLCRQI